MLCREPTVLRNRLDFRNFLFWCWMIYNYYEGKHRGGENGSVVFK
jgi:hypothetical protein